MSSPDGKIIDREPVTLTGAPAKVFSQLYDAQILDRVRIDNITYLSEGLKVKGYFARPKESGVYPTIIWNRGGYRDRGSLDNLTAWLILGSTADWGYCLLATQYRGNKGGEGEEDWGGKDVIDALTMVDVARNLSECNHSKMAVEGASRGGMTTYRMLLENSSFRCAIVHAGISDVEKICEHSDNFKTFVKKQLAGLSREEKKRTLHELSAVYFADKLPKDVPILLLHGTEDKIVPISQSEALVSELENHNIPHRYERIEGGGHVALKDKSYQKIDPIRKEWLAKYLK
jgi:dipeptidyl aminopeptidase/acylaminoacyl peptidase